MATHKSALKRIRSSAKKYERNRTVRSQVKTHLRKAREAIQTGELEHAREATRVAARTLDKAAAKGVVHKNNAARRKSRLMKQLAKLETEQA